MSIETYKLSFSVFIYASHLEVSSFFSLIFSLFYFYFYVLRTSVFSVSTWCLKYEFVSAVYELPQTLLPDLACLLMQGISVGALYEYVGTCSMKIYFRPVISTVLNDLTTVTRNNNGLFHGTLESGNDLREKKVQGIL